MTFPIVIIVVPIEGLPPASPLIFQKSQKWLAEISIILDYHYPVKLYLIRLCFYMVRPIFCGNSAFSFSLVIRGCY